MPLCRSRPLLISYRMYLEAKAELWYKVGKKRKERKAQSFYLPPSTNKHRINKTMLMNILFARFIYKDNFHVCLYCSERYDNFTFHLLCLSYLIVVCFSCLYVVF